LRRRRHGHRLPPRLAAPRARHGRQHGTEDDARVVPLGTLLALDPSLEPVMNLAIGEGLWRDGEHGPWNPWRNKA